MPPVMNRKEICEALGISETMLDEAMLCLTEEDMFDNTKTNFSEILNSLHYNELIGKHIFAIVIIKKLSDLLNHDSNLVMNYQTYYLPFIMQKAFDKWGLKSIVIVRDIEKLLVSEKKKLANRLVGFLYLSLGYKKVESLILNLFDKRELKLEDYLSVINILESKEKRKVQYVEKATKGLEHEKQFLYELIVDCVRVEAWGQSKKIAKKNCAEIYCTKYLSFEKIKNILSSQKLYSKVFRKKYILNNEEKKVLMGMSEKLEVPVSKLFTCLVHKSFVFEYQVESNEKSHIVGANIRRLFLLDFLKRNFSFLAGEIVGVASFLDASSEIDEKILRELNLIKFVKTSKMSELGLSRVYRTVIDSLIFEEFERLPDFGRNKFFISLTNNYRLLFKAIDLRYINATQKLQEFVQCRNNSSKALQEIYHFYDYSEGEKLGDKQVSILTLKSGEKDLLQFESKAASKNEAREINAQKVLKLVYDGFVILFCGQKVTIDLKTLELFLEFIFDNGIFTKRIIEKYNLFGIKNISSTEGFLTKVGTTVLSVKHFLPKRYFKDAINVLLTFVQDTIIFFNGNDLALKVIIEDLCECNTEKFDLSERFSVIKRKSDNYFYGLVNATPAFIRRLNNPSMELQLLVLGKNPANIQYIKKLDNKVLNDVYDHEEYKQFINENVGTLQNGLENLAKAKINSFINDGRLKGDFFTLPSSVPFEMFIKAIFDLFNVENFFVACGFVYLSGIELIEPQINKLLNDNKEFKMIIGSLQNYFSSIEKVEGINKTTVLKLNDLMNRGCEIRTYTDRFYHGKLYIIGTDKFDVVIMGSTNLSRNAFHYNRELDSLFVFNKAIQNPYLQWFRSSWSECSKIPQLDLQKFNRKVSYSLDYSFKPIAYETFLKKVEKVSDDMLKQRLKLWLDYDPTHYYEKVNVAGNDYLAIEYRLKHMVVLDSLNANNKYFVFYDSTIENLIDNIEGKSIQEIFNFSGMGKRGYEMRKHLDLELQVMSYFIGV